LKIIIASTIVPFIEGGGTFIVDWLQVMLRRAGHEVEVFKIPFHSYWPEMYSQMLALRLFDLSAACDLLITIRTPSYLLKHPNKVVWFIHHHRGAYDLWGTGYQDIPDTQEGRRFRRALFESDDLGLRECRRVFSNSQVVADRLKNYNGIEAEVLYPPLFEPERYRSQGRGEAVLYASRLTHHKRQHLAVEAMRHTRTAVRLVLAGAADTKEYLAELQDRVRRHGLESRVTISSGWVTEEEKVELTSKALACLYIPVDEDSYGYPSLEAHHARKGVITCSDSGGTLELIEDGLNGFVVEPTPEALAAAMDRLYVDRELARRMGEAGETQLELLGVSWPHVVSRLTSTLPAVTR